MEKAFNVPNRDQNKKIGKKKIKIFCITKETINKVKWQSTDWEKIFANDIPNKGLTSKI